MELITERRTAALARGSVQAAARSARYEFLERARRMASADVVATGHTSDDHVETILINILRGTGVRGLRGIPAQNGQVIRPMLATTRRDVATYLRQPALDDPSNRNRRFLRARVRHLLVPALGPEVGKSLLRIAALATTANQNLDRFDRASALTEMFVRAGGSAPGLSRAHLDAMKTLLRGRRTGASLSLPGHLSFRVLPDGNPEIGPADPQGGAVAMTIHERDCPGCAEDDATAVHLAAGRLTLATRRPGLRLRPLNGRGTRKLQDLFVDAKVPRHLRNGYPLVFLDGELAWVPGVAVDDRKATPKALPGRHVWLGRRSDRPMVRSEH